MTSKTTNTLSKLALGVLIANASLVNGAPTNGTITSGSASISNGGLYIDQGTGSADVVTIQWDTFNVDAGETVIFNQHVDDVAINNITDQNPSAILGSIQGNGTVFLSNSNGFIFGSSATVNTGSFLATTSTISSSGNSAFSITDSGGDGYIAISSDANFSSNAEGFVAFLSNNITTSKDLIETDASITDENKRQELEAAVTGTSSGNLGDSNDTIIFSNNDQGSIQLAGLGINFSVNESNLNGSSNTDVLQLSDLNISGKTVILSGNQLASLTNSAINLPSSITAENLIIDSAGEIGDISNAIENTFSSSESNSNVSIDKLSIQYRGSNLELNNTVNVNSAGTLALISDNDVILTSQNIYGSSLNLEVQGDNINIGNSVTEFGGSNGLNSLSLNANTGVNLFGSIVSVNNTEINGQLNVDNSLTSAYIFSQSGSITANNQINGQSTQDFELRANTLSLNGITGFSKIRLNAGQINLNSDITSDTIEFSNTSNITLFENITLSGQEIDIDGAVLSAEDGTEGLTIIGTTANNDITLQNISENTTLNALEYIYIYGNQTDSINNVYMSGNFDVDNFCIHSCVGNSTNTTYDVSLEEATQFTNITSFNSSHASITGDYQLNVQGADPSNSTAEIGVIDNLNGLSINNMDSIELTGDIDTKENGLSLLADTILLNPAGNSILIKNDDSGTITLEGSSTIQGNGKAISITTKNSDIHLHNITNAGEVNISNELSSEGSLNLYGNINSNSNITLSKFDQLNILDSVTLTTGSSATFDSSDSTIFANDNDITVYSNTINSGEINARNINLYASNTNLSGNLTATGQVNFFELDGSGLVSSHNDIRLMNDISITGELDLVKSLLNQSSESYVPSISGEDFELSLVASNSDIYLSDFGSDESMNALSITGNGTIHFVSLPNLSGIEGLSLLGNLVFDVGSGDHVFDTSDYNGNLDFSGVDIIGSGTLAFNTGTGELSLGNIGINTTSDDQIFTELAITSTGRLNLHGEIVTTDSNYNFSSLNSIQLEHDITLGTAEMPSVINFGQATINGTYSLTLFSNEITLGTIGNNVALQDLTIVSSDGTITLDNDINMVGNADITANTLNLNNTLTTTGLNVNINTVGNLTMGKDAQINADFGDVNLTSTEGNIGLGYVSSGNTVTIRSELGLISNSINDYISNESTSVNIQSTNQDLYGLLNVGESVDSPIVVNVLNGGTIKAESGGTVFIANLANANIESDSRVIDSASGGDTASLDALTLLKLSSLNNVNMPTVSSNLGLISNLIWQVDEDESIRRIKTPASAPSIYYSRKGWKLGH